MKNSKEYSKKIQKLYKDLKKKHGKVVPFRYEDPVKSLIFAIVSQDVNESSAEEVMQRFDDYFVDMNDLRVALVEEIVEALGDDYRNPHYTAGLLVKLLRSVFEKYNRLTLEPLSKLGKRAAKQAMEDFDGINSYIVDYCMLTAFDGHAVPMTGAMLSYLKDNELVYPDADRADIEGFLTRLIPASNAYEFYSLLRKESDSYITRKRKALEARRIKEEKLAEAQKSRARKKAASPSKASKKASKKAGVSSTAKTKTKVSKKTAKKAAKKTVKKSRKKAAKKSVTSRAVKAKKASSGKASAKTAKKAKKTVKKTKKASKKSKKTSKKTSRTVKKTKKKG